MFGWSAPHTLHPSQDVLQQSMSSLAQELTRMEGQASERQAQAEAAAASVEHQLEELHEGLRQQNEAMEQSVELMARLQQVGPAAASLWRVFVQLLFKMMNVHQPCPLALTSLLSTGSAAGRSRYWNLQRGDGDIRCRRCGGRRCRCRSCEHRCC